MELKDVENLAELARLDLSAGEKEKMLQDFDSILKYVNEIEGVSVSQTKTDHRLHNIWREDEPETRDFDRDLIISQFPEEYDGFLKVKKIL